MKATVLLCDAAEVREGLLFVLGGGWSVCGPDPSTHALAVKLEVPWHMAGQMHRWRIELLDADGQPVEIEGRQVAAEGEFETGKPPDVKPGMPIDAAFALNFGLVALEPDARYVWQLSVDGETDENWQVGFTTRPARLAS